MSQVLFDNKNIEYGVRLLVACICGAIIGVERYKRSKGAGIRTHMLVALGAALFTIISKYGFEDVVCLENIQADAARVASNIVTGVSFLGAGLIFVRGDKVQGLTTAAGIWVTAAVGLTIGCGMCTTGFFCACFILVTQIIFHHGFFKGMENYSHSRVVISVENNDEILLKLKQLFQNKRITIEESHVKRHRNAVLTYTMDISMPVGILPLDVLKIMQECKEIKSIGL